MQLTPRRLRTVATVVAVAGGCVAATPAANAAMFGGTGLLGQVRSTRVSAQGPVAGSGMVRAAAPGDMAANLSSNVEYVTSRPDEGGKLAAGGKFVDGYFYLTSSQQISIYDVSKPEDPQLRSRITFPAPRFENEDVATNGKILLYSDIATTGSLYVYDVRDKAHPRQIAELPGAGTHTMTCVRDCAFAYGTYTAAGKDGSPLRGGEVVDLRDPAHPKVLGDWTDHGVIASRNSHDVTEVSPGRVLTASSPMELLDTGSNLVTPKVLATADNPERLHHVIWPGAGTDRFILSAYETNGTPDCTQSGEVKSWDATQWQQTGHFKQLGSFRLRNGTGTDGNPPANTGLGCSPHWFEPRPDFENGGVVAMGSYDHGLRFLRVNGDGGISEIGHFLADGAEASAAYWVTDDIVYVVDYVRGLDVVRFKEPARPRPGATPPTPGVAASNPGPVPAAPTADPLRVALAVDRTGAPRALRQGIRVRVRCSRACRGVLELTRARDSASAGGGTLKLGTAGRGTVRLKLSSRIQRTLRRVRRDERLTLRATVFASGGARRSIQRDITVRRLRR